MTLTDVTEAVGIVLVVVGVALVSIPVALCVAGVAVIGWSIARAWSGRDVPLRKRDRS